MILVVGRNGQLANCLSELAPEDVHCMGREEVNISDKDSLAQALDALPLSSVINASAYTAVDNAESDVEGAFKLNGEAVANLAEYCAQRQLHFTHVSTDYVFSGDKGSPYLPDDEYAPIGVYGDSKVAGEKAVSASLPELGCIIRTSWVYSRYGNNFVKTMLRLMASKPELGVIDDQVGTPTSAKGLARACLSASRNKVSGIHHYTDEGVASWYDFAVAIQQLAQEKCMLADDIPIKPIPTSAYPTPAKRPSYSVLDKASFRHACPDVPMQHWRAALSDVLEELKLN